MSKNRNRAQNVTVAAAASVLASDAETPSTVTEREAALDAELEIETTPDSPALDAGLATDDNVQLIAPPAPSAAPKSIRQLIMGGLLAGTPRAVLDVELNTHFPNHRAAQIPVKHIAWYAGTMKKAGTTLPTPRAVTPEEAVAIAELKERRKAAQASA